MSKKYDLIVAGEINPDLILSGEVVPAFGQVEKLVDSAVLTIGSSSVIFACGAARLGLKVAFCGVCGDDLLGHFMLSEMRKLGVDPSPVSLDPVQQTGLSVILARPADRAILTYTGSMTALRAEQVTNELLHQARHLHVASYFLQTALQPGLPDLYNRARQIGLSTSLDTNWDPSGKWGGVKKLLPLVDVFFPNENEVLALGGDRDPVRAAESLAVHCGTVAVKLGAQGALAWRGKEMVRVPAPAVKVVDTVGAGDTFDAGFLYGWLDGWSLEEDLRLGVVCGSLSTRGAGGTSAQPTLEEAMRYVHRIS